MSNVIVAGVGPGMGCSIVRLLTEKRHSVSVISRTDFGEKISKEVGAYYTRCDLSNFNETAGAIKQIATEMKGVDALVHCAGGYYSSETIDRITPEFFTKALQNNAVTLFNTVHAVVPLMIGRGGSIIAITAAKNVYYNGNAAYAAAKGAVAYMVKRLASELAPHNIRVNSIAPGFISKDDCGSPSVDNKLLKGTRYASINIALAVDSLISNPIITGQDLEVDGGVSTQIRSI